MKDRGRGPESAFWDTLKGKRVTVRLHDMEYEATLLWVDRYSIGLRGEDDVEELVMKSSLVTVRAV